MGLQETRRARESHPPDRGDFAAAYLASGVRPRGCSGLAPVGGEASLIVSQLPLGARQPMRAEEDSKRRRRQ